MYFHIINTVVCDSRCRYCYAKSMEEDFDNSLDLKLKFDYDAPPRPSYSVEELKAFLEKSKEKPTVTFYGGEPLLETKRIKEIMDKIDARFMIQTTGKLFPFLPKEYANRFETILISIDGDKEITDFNRGKGTYDAVMKSINHIKSNGFGGEIIARMVVDEHSDVFKQVRHLLGLGLFDSVHWQLDAGFYKSDFAKRDFTKFVEKYNSEVSKLVAWWVSEMKKGKVWKIYPFFGIFESLYYLKKEKLRCGSGYANYTIATNGKIGACPIISDAQALQVGDIWKSHPDKLEKIYVSGFCKDCNILDLCGGRCLYANRAALWPEEGQKMICGTVQHLIKSLGQEVPGISQLIEEGKISKKDFFYEKYNGAEIIP